jgi:hypothetical protein
MKQTAAGFSPPQFVQSAGLALDSNLGSRAEIKLPDGRIPKMENSPLAV